MIQGNGSETKYLIDNIFSNSWPFPSSGIIISDLSDHFPVYTNLKVCWGKLNSPFIHHKNIRKSDPDNIAKVNWNDVLSDQNVESAFDNCV